MRADSVEVSWDKKKSKWVVRIQAGEEVIRRYCGLAKDADEPALRKAAQDTLRDEGYDSDPLPVAIRSSAA